jgi:hypothetical protein
MQGPPPGSIKVNVITAPAEELEEKLKAWHGQHGRARVGGAAQSSASHEGKVVVTVTMWYTE